MTNTDSNPQDTKIMLTLEQVKAAISDMVPKVVARTLREMKNEESDDNKILDLEGVCKKLGKSKSTIHRLVKDGEIKAYKKGKYLYFKESEILK